jgi:hypothetical protein
MSHLSAVSSSSLASAQVIRSSADIQESPREASVGRAMLKASIVFFAALAVIVSFFTMPLVPALIASAVIITIASALVNCVGPSNGAVVVAGAPDPAVVVVNRQRPPVLVVSEPRPVFSPFRGISTWRTPSWLRSEPTQPVRFAPSASPLQGSSSFARTIPGGGHFAQPVSRPVTFHVPAAPFVQPSYSGGGVRVQPGSGR